MAVLDVCEAAEREVDVSDLYGAIERDERVSVTARIVAGAFDE